MNRSELARERRLCAAVFAAALLLDLSFRSQYFNFDGVACAIAVELSDFKHLVHGNHLAYGVVAWLFDRAWRLLGYRGRAILTLQVLDGVLGAAGAAVFASLLRRSGRGEREAALGAAALAVSYAWWFWSLEAQVYMLGALFAALAAREALAEKPRPARAGAWLAAAVLGHVGHLMALPAIAWMLWRKRGRAALAPFAASLAGLVAAAYAAAGILAVRPRTLDDLRLWLLGSAALGVDRAFSWHSDAWSTALLSWGAMTFEVFCGFAGSSGAVRLAGAALAALPLAAAAFGAARGGREARFWLLWLAGYAALFLNWEPGTIVYRVSDLLGLWALALLGLQGLTGRARSAALAAWTAAAFAYNLAFAIRPAADPASNADLVETNWTAARVPPDSWIVATSRGAVYLPYFAGLKTVNARYFGDEASLYSRLDALAASGARVYATDRTLESAGLLPELARYGLETAATGEGLTLYRVSRAAAPRPGK
ncbi:MAG TPA: hypothetical protein VN915_05365 [Elusimicrobiota bacterium]|nr:hypothetical protein [Elusimicrobiota bacterium]